MRTIQAFILLASFGFFSSLKAQTNVPETSPKFRYFCELNTGFLAGELVSGIFQLKNGVSFGKFWSASLVTGLEGHRPGTFIPIGLEGRFSWNDSKTSPFLSLSANYLQRVGSPNYYSYYYSENHRTMGFSLGAKIGIRHNISNSVAVVSGIGYRFAFVEERGVNNVCWNCLPYETNLLHYMNRFELTFGLIFK
jgi:hypothetical protein